MLEPESQDEPNHLCHNGPCGSHRPLADKDQDLGRGRGPSHASRSALWGLVQTPFRRVRLCGGNLVQTPAPPLPAILTASSPSPPPGKQQGGLGPNAEKVSGGQQRACGARGRWRPHQHLHGCPEGPWPSERLPNPGKPRSAAPPSRRSSVHRQRHPVWVLWPHRLCPESLISGRHGPILRLHPDISLQMFPK